MRIFVKLFITTLLLVVGNGNQSYFSRLLTTLTYVTNKERGLTVQNYCKSTDRLQLYSDYGINGDIPHSGTVSNFFDLDTKMVDYALNNEWSKAGDQLRRNGGKLFAFIGAWCIGLGLTLILVPFWLCCCICPWSCPIWNRKHQKMPYTKCELIYPAVISIIMLLIILACSIVGIASSFKANNGYNKFACVSGVVVDDLANGNVSLTDKSLFFSGVRTIDTQLRDMTTKIVALNAEVAKLGTAATGSVDAKAKIATAKSATAQVPSTSQAALTLTYSTPLQSSSPSSTIQSTFPTILGTKSSASSLVGSAYTTLTLYQSYINSMNIASDAYTANSPSYLSSIQSATNETNKTATDIEGKDREINNFFNTNKSSANGLTIGEYVIYGLLIGLSVLMIIVVVCTVCSDSAGSGCRKFMYFICFWMFWLTIVSFGYCIFASIVNPFTYYSCQYMQENLQSKSKLQDTLTKRFNIDANVANNISQCVSSDGSGRIASNILGSQVFNSLTSLNTTYLNLSSIVDINSGNYIQLSHNYLLNNITSYKKAQKVDINDNSALNQLIKLSQASSYSCSSALFAKDSWVPSNGQDPSYIACKISQGANSDSSTCTSSLGFSAGAAGCTGCMDTYDLFKANSTASTVKSALDARYSDSSCNLFNTELSNVWQNFYKKKSDTLTPVQSRAANARTQALTVKSTLPYFTQVQQNIDSGFSNIVDTQYGLLNGLNCKIVGQDVRLMKSVFCQQIFVYTYFVRVIFGIISFALLFMLCCITCAGHRNCKQQQFQAANGDDKNKKKYGPQQNNNNQIDYQKYNAPSSGQGLYEVRNVNKYPPIQGNNYGYFNNYENNNLNPYQSPIQSNRKF